MDSEWPDKIEKWLSQERQWFIDKLWQVVVELEAERALLGSSHFKIPLKRFKHNKRIDPDNARKILINLDSKKIIFTFKELGRTPPSDNPEKPTGFIGVGIAEDERIFDDPSTEITLTHGFKYLYFWLEKRQHPERFKQGNEEPQTFKWDPKPDEGRGVLLLPNGDKPIIFRSGNFGGINELIKNIGRDCKRQQLKNAIAKYTQGNKSADEIKLSKWLYDLRIKRPEFFRHFKIEYLPPDNYRLLYFY